MTFDVKAVFGVLAIALSVMNIIAVILVIVVLFRKDKDYSDINEMCNFILVGCALSVLLMLGYYNWDSLIEQL